MEMVVVGGGWCVVVVGCTCTCMHSSMGRWDMPPKFTDCADGRDAVELDRVPAGPDRSFRHVLAVLVRAPATLDKLQMGDEGRDDGAVVVLLITAAAAVALALAVAAGVAPTSVVNPSGRSVVESDAALAFSRAAGRRCHFGRWTALPPRNALAEGSTQNATSASAAAATERLTMSAVDMYSSCGRGGLQAPGQAAKACAAKSQIAMARKKFPFFSLGGQIRQRNPKCTKISRVKWTPSLIIRAGRREISKSRSEQGF